MIDALICGRLHGAPVARTSKAGSAFVTGKVRVPMRDGEAIFVSVVGFNENVVRALQALGDGDSVALSGELSASAYVHKDGTARPSLDLLVHAVLSPFALQRRRKAASAATPAAAGDLPFDDELSGVA